MNDLRDLLLQAIVQLDDELEKFRKSDYWYKECAEAEKKNQELIEELAQLRASYKAEAARKEGEGYEVTEHERGITTQA